MDFGSLREHLFISSGSVLGTKVSVEQALPVEGESRCVEAVSLRYTGVGFSCCLGARPFEQEEDLGVLSVHVREINLVELLECPFGTNLLAVLDRQYFMASNRCDYFRV